MFEIRLSGARRAIRSLALACLALFCATARAEDPAPQYPADSKGWSAAAVRDINAAYDVLVANHPGTYDKANPEFPARLKKARAAALELTPEVRDAAGYVWALGRFTAAIGDGHAGVFPNNLRNAGPNRPPTWPGFVAVWRGNGFYVFGSEVDGIVRGAKVISCDGVPVNDLMRRNVFRFFGRGDQPGQWWSAGSMLFADAANPFVTLPKTCIFESGGVTADKSLAWRPVDPLNQNWRDWSKNGRAGDTLPLGMTEPEAGLYWIALPTFAPNQQQQATYRDLIKQIRDRRDSLLSARAIVIDLRGNGGGSSMWSSQIATALWGARAVIAAGTYFKGMEAWWRVSPGNVAYMRDSIATFKAAGLEGLVTTRTALADSMQKALDKGDKFYVEPREANPDAENLPAVPPLGTPVYVIVSGQCASACLDALDVFTRFPNTKLIGAPSSADSNYLDIRREILPSGLATVVIPLKVWVHRPRKSGEYYSPAIMVTDLDWSTANFLSIVKKDLAGRPKP